MEISFTDIWPVVKPTSCYVQLFWVTEGNFRIQFRFFESCGNCCMQSSPETIPNVRSFWKWGRGNKNLTANDKKQKTFAILLLQTCPACTTSIFLVTVDRRFNNNRWTLHLQNELLCRCAESITNAELPCFVLLVALLLCLVLENSQQQTGRTTSRLLLTQHRGGCASKTELVASLYKYMSDCALLKK